MVDMTLWKILEGRISQNILPGDPTLAFGSPRSNLVTAEIQQLTSGYLGEKEERKETSKETMIEIIGSLQCGEVTTLGKDLKQVQIQHGRNVDNWHFLRHKL